jgi:nucleoside-diphosphate-sugar epimerase
MDFPPILVLGATGRVGGILRRAWAGSPVRWQARYAAPPGPAPGSGWAVLDPLADPAALVDAARGCAAILCLAGVTPAGAAQGRQMADNTALADAAVRAGAVVGAPVLLASSAAVYGNRPGVLQETAPLSPVSDYGRAKARMEHHATALGAELGVPVCALRIGNIAGVDAILGGWRPGFRLDRFADGRTPRRSYVGPVTLARLLAGLIARQHDRGDLPGVLNLAAPGAVEMGALLDAAGLGWSPRPAQDTVIAEVVLDTRRLEHLTDLPDTAGTVQNLVAEWRRLHMQAGEA